MKLVHVIEKFFNSGAASSLKQIHDSLLSSSLVDSQEVVCLKPEKVDEAKKIPQWFPVEGKILSYASFQELSKSQDYRDCVFVFHKLMCSPTRSISNVLSRTGMPFFAINHTYADSAAFNKLYNFKHCVAVSDHMSRKLVKVNRDIKTYTVKNIVDVEYVSSYGKKEKDKEVFLTGRINSLNAIKYNADFIRWVCGLNLSKKHIHEYVGAGQHMNEAVSICESSSSNKSLCIMKGSINEEKEKFETLKAWDVFLYHINRPEGTSMSVLESLACGVPVVCCDLPGNNELIKNGINGFVFKNFSHANDILSELCKNEKKLEDLKKSTIEWANNNLTKIRLQKEYELVIEDVRSSFNGNARPERSVKPARKPSQSVVHKNKIDRRDKIKKIVADRYAISLRKEKASQSGVKKQIGSRILQKSTDINVEKTLRTYSYYPLMSEDMVCDVSNIASDFFGICSSGYEHIDYGGLCNFIEYPDKDFFMFLSKKSKCEIIDNVDNVLPLKNNDILFIRRNQLDFIKDLITKKRHG